MSYVHVHRTLTLMLMLLFAIAVVIFIFKVLFSFFKLRYSTFECGESMCVHVILHFNLNRIGARAWVDPWSAGTGTGTGTGTGITEVAPPVCWFIMLNVPGHLR
jgi:hypothetical protein